MTDRSSQREQLIEQYRNINVDYDWWDGVYDQFKADMLAVGISVDTMRFSGFYSQGDGACFTGSLDSSVTYLDHHHEGQFPMLRKLMELGGDVYVRCQHRGRYYHEYCTTFGTEADLFYNCVESHSELQDAVVAAWQDLLDKELSDFEEAVTDQWRAYMRDLYHRLEEEYDHLTSDEVVWDTIVANELDVYEEADDDEYDEAA